MQGVSSSDEEARIAAGAPFQSAGNGGIHSIAARAQNVHARFGSFGLWCADHGMAHSEILND
jgi:hypothetical protein